MADPAVSLPIGSGGTSPSEGAGQVLQLVRQRGPVTISELAAGLGLSRSTVLHRTGSLLEHGLISSGGRNTGSRGRPAVLASFNPAAAVVLAAQIGMTGTRLAATDLAGDVLAERLIPVDVPAGPARLMADLGAAFDELIVAAGGPAVAGVGVGMPSSVELLTYARSLDRNGPTSAPPAAGQVPSGRAGWDQAFIARSMRDRYRAPVFVDLDVNLLAQAERSRGWPAAEAFVCVKLGTLINASIVVNGRPVHGVSDRAGELGHFKVSGSTVPCTCGGTGCLDAVASGNALVRDLTRAGLDVQHVADVVALVAQGQPEAVRAVREAGRQIGEVLGSVVNLLNPGVIIAWGYLTDAEAPLFAGIREGLYQSALPGSSERLTIRRTALGALAGVRGAAAMVLDHVLAPDAVDRLVQTGSWADAWPDRDAG